MNGTVAELKFSSQLINLLHITDVCEGLLHAAQRTLNCLLTLAKQHSCSEKCDIARVGAQNKRVGSM